MFLSCIAAKISLLLCVLDFWSITIETFLPRLKRIRESSSGSADFPYFNSRMFHSISNTSGESNDTFQGIVAVDIGVAVLASNQLNCSFMYLAQQSATNGLSISIGYSFNNQSSRPSVSCMTITSILMLFEADGTFVCH